MRQFAFVGLANPAPDGVVDVQRARIHATASFDAIGRPDSVAHVRIGIVVDARLAEVAYKLLELFDFGIALGQVERDRRNVVHAVIGDAVNLDAAIAKALGTPL